MRELRTVELLLELPRYSLGVAETVLLLRWYGRAARGASGAGKKDGPLVAPALQRRFERAVRLDARALGVGVGVGPVQQ